MATRAKKDHPSAAKKLAEKVSKDEGNDNRRIGRG
jgi:hypothetical protein